MHYPQRINKILRENTQITRILQREELTEAVEIMRTLPARRQIGVRFMVPNRKNFKLMANTRNKVEIRNELLRKLYVN